MAISDATKERLFQALIGLLVALTGVLTVYLQSKQTQKTVQQSAVSAVAEIKEQPVAKVAAALEEGKAEAAEAVAVAEADAAQEALP